jgi:hypothetical protein
MFWSQKAKTARFIERAEDIGGSLQLELYRSAKSFLSLRYDDKTAGRIASALGNYVFRFGFITPEHADDQQLMALFTSEKPVCLTSFGDIFKTNATGALILLGAAWRVEFDTYKRHMRELADDGLVKHGRATPDVSRSLPKSDLPYMYVLVAEEF